MTVLSFLPKGAIPTMDKEQEDRNEEPRTRSIILPVYLWEKIDKDAKRCKRSMTKHVEAILSLYYGAESSVNIDEEILTSAHDVESHKPRLKKTA
jgi:hypothetical protein